MAKKARERLAPMLDMDALTTDFEAQLDAGLVRDALLEARPIPSLHSPRGQTLRLFRCVWRGANVVDTRARGLHLEDARIESCDLANLDLTGSRLERLEIRSTRLTGAILTETQLKSVLFAECKLDLALLRMARLSQCVFEQCNLAEADLYGADLSGTIFRDCDLGRADLSQAKLAGADLRTCRLDGMRGTPAAMEGLIVSPDQAALLMPLFGVRVVW